ncbi:MAG: TAXI family TRAP transporter solute-binding subunit [Kiloniellales bacterium]|nr:TAXI family TRAP transporter solute-binding subunit [Kiloniellales bacterium]
MTWARERARGAPPATKGALVALSLCAAVLLSAVTAQAQDVIFFRVGTGATAGTYFPIGGLIASAISNPPGSRECERGGSCGVPGLIAVAQSTSGSVANVEGIASGTLESGLSQADIAYWAHTGTEIYRKRGQVPKLRAIANLFPESVHLVVSRASGIESIADLRGKRISIDREGSGTRVDALLILHAFGVAQQDFEAHALPVGQAADLLRAGELDGFFFVAGTPANAIEQLAAENLIALVPINGPAVDDLLLGHPFFARASISSGTYFNIPQTETLSVGAQWLVSAEVSEDLIYEVTRALWHESTRQLLDGGHPKGRLIRIETALDGLGVPLHPGAERYYEEIGALIGDMTADEAGGVMPERNAAPGTQ